MRKSPPPPYGPLRPPPPWPPSQSWIQRAQSARVQNTLTDDRTRLKRLPVISREHFRKTRTFINTCWVSQTEADKGPCHVSGIFLPLRVNSLPLATIYEVKIPLRKWKKSLLQRNPAQMTWHIIIYFLILNQINLQIFFY
jgi:hypothetical protein